MLDRERVVCPVCKATLAFRVKGRNIDVKCRECNVIYTYGVSASRPTSNHKDSKRCNCSACREDDYSE